MDIVAAVEFERWCENVGLTEVTRSLLKSEGFTTLDTVRVLCESDLEVLNLDPAQKYILESSIMHLNSRDTQTSLQVTPLSQRADKIQGEREHSDLTNPDSEKEESDLGENAPEPMDTSNPQHKSDGNASVRSPPYAELLAELGRKENRGETIGNEKEAEYDSPRSSANKKKAVVSSAKKSEKVESKGINIPKSKNTAENDESPISPTGKGNFFSRMKSPVSSSVPGKTVVKPEKPEKTEKQGKDKENKKKGMRPKFLRKKGDKNEEFPVNFEEEKSVAPGIPTIVSFELPENSVSPDTTVDHPLAEPVKPLKERFLEHSRLVKTGYPEHYELPQVVIDRNDANFIRYCEISVPDFPFDIVTEEKVILCVGASGAGKTTLINGLANNLLDVKWSDSYRFQIIPDCEDQNPITTQSQTKYISVYSFYVMYNLTPCKFVIIDTPGFGDTEGINKDQELDYKIRALFENALDQPRIDQLHAVCFTAQACEAKLNAFQRYIYHRVLSVFGKDVEENIFMMVTFADAQYPLVIRSLEDGKVPFKKFFKFNNSALFANNSAGEGSGMSANDQKFNQMFWDMGSESFKSFFDFLQNEVQPVSLLLTKDVLAKRESLQVYISGLQDNINQGLTTLDQLRQEMDVVKQHERDIALNRDFVYTVKEYYTEKVNKPEGQHVTNCQNCMRTCHHHCKFPNNDDKRKCSAMDNDGYCRVCTPKNGGKCKWDIHYNMPYILTYKSRMVEKRVEDLFEKYKQATDRKLDAESLLQQIAHQFTEIQGEVLWQTNEIRKCLKAIGEIALKPNPLTTVDYIDQMIVAETSNHQEGWDRRVEQLHHARKQAEYLQKLEDEGYDPWEEHKSILDSEEETKASRLTSVSEFLHKLKSGLWSRSEGDSEEIDEDDNDE